LTALKDRIYCLSDHTLDGPTTPSSCFLFESTFYDDLRDQRAVRYSDTIVEWVRNESRYAQPGLDHYSARSMSDVCFNQLAIRLGSHYMYQHQGDCVHTLIITQIRMSHGCDITNLNAYPLKVYQCKTRRKKCRVCDLYPAAYVTYGDKLASENPFFYCEECYRPMHYSYQGSLLYNDFQVYPYDHE
jgi:snRNA-activating protein complex subunit 3